MMKFISKIFGKYNLRKVLLLNVKNQIKKIHETGYSEFDNQSKIMFIIRFSDSLKYS
jgi:hypothetical protein